MELGEPEEVEDIDLDDSSAALICGDDAFSLLLPKNDEVICSKAQLYITACYLRAHDVEFVSQMLLWLETQTGLDNVRH